MSTPTKNSVDNQELDDLADLLSGVAVSEVRKCDTCQCMLVHFNYPYIKAKSHSLKATETATCIQCTQNNAVYRATQVNSNEKLHGSAKIAHLMRVLRDEENNDTEDEVVFHTKTIVFSQFTSMLDIIEPFLKQARINFLRCESIENFS